MFRFDSSINKILGGSKMTETKRKNKTTYMAVVEDQNRRHHTVVFDCKYKINNRKKLLTFIDEIKAMFGTNFQAVTFLKEMGAKK